MGIIIQRPLRLAGTAIAATFAAVSLGSFSPEDPSLRAAPPYQPDLWNDVSNEDLTMLYKEFGPAIERMLAAEYDGKSPERTASFPRKAHTNNEKAYLASQMVNSFIDANPGHTIPELSSVLSVRYGLSAAATYRMVFALKMTNHAQGYQSTNNCYAYAANDRDKAKSGTDFQAAPGNRTLGNAFVMKIDTKIAANYEHYVRHIIKGNVSDGMIFTGSEMGSREGYYRAALYMRRAERDTQSIHHAHEYHYIRQNRDGGWSHKYGPLNVTDTDYSGRKITNPRTADMGNYKFIGYFLVPQGGIDVGPPDEKSTKPGSRPGLNLLTLAAIPR